jgi:hypothetical protein
MSGLANRASSSRRRVALVAGLVAAGVVLGLAGLWLGGMTIGDQDPAFRGRPESEWIQNLKYHDDEQVKEWRGYGAAGVQVLVRGLERANHRGERSYRWLYRQTPGFVARCLPWPKQDSTRSTRMCLASLLSSLGKDASNALPIMVWTVNRDEDDSVRQCSINFFTGSEDERCVLNQMPAQAKRQLLPGLIRAVQHPGNWGLRNNAANALRWYPEQRKVVAPVLVKALQDPQPQVRLLAATALNRVDPAAAKASGAVAMILAIAKNPDDQLASRAISALRDYPAHAAEVVPVLLECLESTNTLVACEAVWALEWSPPEYRAYADSIVPALSKTAERNDNVGRYARVALKRFPSGGESPQAIK